jgi:hypothetical protein
MSLSVCLLTRNEEKNITRAVRSVAGLADQVVVADTGSTDRTAAVAASLGAQIYQVDWQDDFAAARDFAIRQATGDWILWLNPDEELLASCHAELRHCLERDEAFGYSVRVQELLKPNESDYFTETVQLRLFRRRPGVCSVGRLHPAFVPSLEETARREGKQIYAAEVVLRRHAYLSPLTEPKLRWSVRLLELELRDRPGQLHYLIEYGRTLLLLNDPKGHAVLAEAVEQIAPICDAPTAPLAEVQRLLEYLLTVSPEHCLSRLAQSVARELALRWFPFSPPLVWHNAEHFFKTGNYRQAAGLLERLVQFGRTGQYDKSEGFHPGIIGDSALRNLGVCYTRLGELDKAEACFLPLLGSKTVQEQARQDLAYVQSLRVHRGGPSTGKSP